MSKNGYFDEILDASYGRGLCHQCGNYQSHSLRWCSVCGGEFCKHNHSTIDAIGIMMRFERGKGQHLYFSAIYARKLESAGFTKREFSDYILARLKQPHI